MEPVNGKIYARNIADALIKLLPDKQSEITANYEKYAQQLDELDAYIKTSIGKIEPAKRILITSHDSFHYYGRRYGIRLESVLGTSTDADVRTSDLMRINAVIRENKIPVVFIESTLNPNLLEQVASDNKIKIGGKLYSDSLGDKDSPANTYINMVKSNTDVIVNGLTSVASADGDDGQPKDQSKWFIWLGVAFLAVFLVIWLFRKKPNAA
jgi:LPXTG-motif cell wall-anchored protein